METRAKANSRKGNESGLHSVPNRMTSLLYVLSTLASAQVRNVFWASGMSVLGVTARLVYSMRGLCLGSSRASDAICSSGQMSREMVGMCGSVRLLAARSHRFPSVRCRLLLHGRGWRCTLDVVGAVRIEQCAFRGGCQASGKLVFAAVRSAVADLVNRPVSRAFVGRIAGPHRLKLFCTLSAQCKMQLDLFHSIPWDLPGSSGMLPTMLGPRPRNSCWTGESEHNRSLATFLVCSYW